MNTPLRPTRTLDRPLHHRILLVDDEPVVRDVILQLLSRDADLLMAEVGSAKDALQLLRGERFDLLISDKNLPDQSGIELVAQARGLQDTLDAMVITAYASPESVLEAFAAGASDYLLKPFDDVRTVRAKVRAALERRRERMELAEQAQAFAQEATHLLRSRPASSAEWQRLEWALNRYEQTVAEGTKTDVPVVGGHSALPVLDAADFFAFACEEDAPALANAELVVVDTASLRWRSLSEGFLRKGASVILWVSRQLELPEMLTALEMRLELVGADANGISQLPDKVRQLLRGRAIRHGQLELTRALATFRARLGAA